MSHRNGRDVLTPGEAAHPYPDLRTPRSRRRRRQLVIALVSVGGLFVAPQVLPASAQPAPGSESGSGADLATAAALAAVEPPAGMSWFEGTLTDQAGHRLNNVNVEAWNAVPSEIGPVASNLSYAGAPADGRHQSGVFRLEVPGGAGYRITFSTFSGQEDGDPWRMQTYGGGRLVMARTAVGGAAVAAAPGRIINLGTVRLARLGSPAHPQRVASRTTARLMKHKIKAGRRGRVQVRVTSAAHVTGAVRAQVGRKSVRATLGSGGRVTIRLPKVKRGKHLVKVTYLGSTTVAPSKAKPVRLVVKPKKR